MKRRQLLKWSAGWVCVSSFPIGWLQAAGGKKPKVLYYTQSAGFRHGVVTRKNGQLAFSEKVLMELGRQHGYEVVCTQDGGVFDGDLDQYAAIALYTSGDLTRAKENPMSSRGKQRFLDWVAAGGGLIGIHSATDTFRTPKDQIDPFLAMLGGEFLTHGEQQKAVLRVVSPKFPGARQLGKQFQLLEEWYALYKFAKDLHVILVQETKGMKGDMYQRPPYPAAWARMHGKGRVFYTSLGHREDVWTNKEYFQPLILGALAWTTKQIHADVTPNIHQVTPHANQLTLS